MGTEVNADWLRVRALEYLREGGDESAAQWLQSCPLLDGRAQQTFGDHVSITLIFGGSRADISAFQEEYSEVAEQVYDAFAAVSRPNPVSYIIQLQYLTASELSAERKPVVLELEAPARPGDDIPF